MKKACCKEENNLEVQESGRADLVLRVCKVCKCRHFELTLDKGNIGLKGKGL